MHSTVLILYTSQDQSRSTPFLDQKYQKAYEHLYVKAKERGLFLCRAPFDWYDADENCFVKAWTYDGSSWVIISNICPDAIYDKSEVTEQNQPLRRHLAQRFPFLNDPEFSQVANSKYATSLLLPQHFKPYRKVIHADALEAALHQFGQDPIVAKPEFGSGGKGVLIENREQLLKKKDQLNYPVILQEFIDSSHGIPGIISGHHDLRLVYINNLLIYSYIRIPKQGSLLANIAQGGSMEIVKAEQLPSSLDRLIKDVQNAFSHFPRKIYTIDLMFDENAQPWIVELNTMPGIYFSPGQESERDRFFDALLTEFQQLVRNEDLNELT